MRIRFHGITVALAVCVFSARGAAGQDTERPSLVVMISVDQLRGDLLDRYEEVFTGGLRRFLDEGYRFTSASHAHAVTHTAPGHAALSTGVFPSRSGIVANSWQQATEDGWRSMYAVEDVDSPILGLETVVRFPGRSPRNLLRTGLADWVRAADGEARTVSVSAKDRAAIPMAGQTDQNVYWLARPLARFVTSTYYASVYPAWLARFNDEVMRVITTPTVWNSPVPDRYQDLARADSADYEGRGGNTTFPHLSLREAGGEDVRLHNTWVLSQSSADAAVLALARTATDELELGQRDNVDYLAVSLSATDYVGHAYGPFSQEQLANLVHLDRALGDFLDYLDDTVGEGNWVAGLSADHGVVTMPEYEQELGNDDVERVNTQRRAGELLAALNEVTAEGGSLDEIAERLARSVEEKGLVEKAYTHHDLTRGEPADSFAVLFRNSHYPGRAHHRYFAPSALSQSGVEVRFREGDLVFPREAGTEHETPYWYDRHVPLIFLGAGVSEGSSDAPAYTVDMAPTLAALGGIQAPFDLDGKIIYRK